MPTTAGAPTTSEQSTVPTSLSTTTVPTSLSTTVPIVTPTTVAVDPTSGTGFEPACVETSGGSGTIDRLAGLDTFGPLGSTPRLTLRLPGYRGEGEGELGDVAVRLARIPGGILVEIVPDSFGGGTGWELVAIDHDGSVRWRRCAPDRWPVDLWVAPAEDGPDMALMRTYDDAGPSTALAFDLATGADVDIAGAGELPALAGSARFVLLGRNDGVRVSLDTDRLQLLDLLDGTVVELPYPERADGQEPFRLIWRVVDADPERPVVLQYDPFGAAVGAWVDGVWTTDAAQLARYAPGEARETFAADGSGTSGIEGIAGDGQRRWFHATEGSLPGEGFHLTEVDGVVLANVCRQAAAEYGCDRGAFVALDASTGAVRWELPEFRAVGIVADGYAIVSDVSVYAGDQASSRSVMIDLDTGEPVPGQDWAADAFVNGCCGEGEYMYVGGDGGVVWAVHVDHVDVYYPDALSRPTVSVAVGG